MAAVSVRVPSPGATIAWLSLVVTNSRELSLDARDKLFSLVESAPKASDESIQQVIDELVEFQKNPDGYKGNFYEIAASALREMMAAPSPTSGLEWRVSTPSFSKMDGKDQT